MSVRCLTTLSLIGWFCPSSQHDRVWLVDVVPWARIGSQWEAGIPWPFDLESGDHWERLGWEVFEMISAVPPGPYQTNHNHLPFQQICDLLKSEEFFSSKFASAKKTMTSFSFENLFSEDKSRRPPSKPSLPFSFNIQKFLNLKQVNKNIIVFLKRWNQQIYTVFKLKY